jgi:hypothetical protein
MSHRKTNATAPVLDSTFCFAFFGLDECFYEKVIKVKADVAALLNLFSDVSIDVRW